MAQYSREKISQKLNENKNTLFQEPFHPLLIQPVITCSKLTIKTPERCQWRRSKVYILSFEHISHFVLLFLLLTLSRLMPTPFTGWPLPTAVLPSWQFLFNYGNTRTMC